jgi:hypothetical protein
MVEVELMMSAGDSCESAAVNRDGRTGLLAQLAQPGDIGKPAMHLGAAKGVLADLTGTDISQLQ